MDPKQSKPSRRDVVAAGSTLLATPILGAFAASDVGAAPLNNNPQVMQNPLDMYPKPPFKRQHQDPPGLAMKMEPRPDHGETTYKGSGKLAGRKALITGGDSSIGRAAAIAYAREGADVAIGYLPVEEPDAKEVIDLIKAEGRRAVALPGDIQDEGFCNKLVADAVAGLGGLDILVNNAAKQVYKESILDVSTDQLEKTFRTNVFAMFWITKAAIPHLKPGSAIICTTSINAYDPSPRILDYAMTKGAVAIFVKGLSRQLIEKGIRVNGVAPGPIWTPCNPAAGSRRRSLKSSARIHPLSALGSPRNWRLPMCCSLVRNPASSAAKSTASPEGIPPPEARRAIQ
ncbi:MAG TPA: SDR family oxidoreductase [Tepidisphaeraceae bacterium]|nr:SDR family oxidoreductase [Tepidisphaeraceae bacterium]